MKFQPMLALLLLFFLSYDLTAQTFTRITDANNPINSTTMSGNYRGCAWIDVDADGDLDLSVAGAGTLFRNDGNDNFSTISTPGLFNGGQSSVSWGDVDQDGTIDCLYSYNQDSRIYLNDGTGNLTAFDPEPNGTIRGWSASLGDWDNNGYLDAIWSVAINFGFNTGNVFYSNNGDGTFTKVDSFEFSSRTADYTVGHWIDYDDDGDQDLFFASGPGGVAARPDHYYRNLLIELGYPRFVKNTSFPFATQSQDGQCYNFIDADLDGDRDMYLTNWTSALNRYYELDSGTYKAVQNSLIMGGGNAMLSNGWGDLDNDGYEDVIVTGGSLGAAGIFRNTGNHQYQKLTNPFLGAGGPVSGLSLGDYDEDGDLDFFAIGGNSVAPNGNGYRGLYKNNLNNGNHWVQFELTGKAPSNTSALGARVWVKANIGGQDRWLQREISAQNTFMGHNALRVHFGLAQNTMIDSVKINWPSDDVEYLLNVEVDSLYRVMQSNVTNALDEDLKPDVASLQIVPNPTQGISEIRLPSELPIPFGTLEVTDMSGKIIRKEMPREPSIQLDVSGLAAGTYMLKWEIGGQVFWGKIVVE